MERHFLRRYRRGLLRSAVTFVSIYLLLGGFLSLVSAAPDTSYFHTYERMMREIETLALRFPDLCRVETLSVTETGRRAVVAVKVSDNPEVEETEPAVMFNGAHHGCEIMGVEICMALLDWLVTGYVQPEIKRLVDSLEIFVVPMVNPDGHAVNFTTAETTWRKNTRDNNRNGRFDSGDGVDLNRNYPFLWEMGGSDRLASREYRGPFPLSEPETQGLARFTHREKFVANICYHSSQQPSDWEKIYYPWLWSGTFSPDYYFFRAVAESLAASISRDDGTGTYTAVPGFATSGGLYRNWSYYTTGNLSLTVEVGRGYYPDTSLVDSLVRRNLRGAKCLLERALGPGIWGRVYDSLTGEQLSATVVLPAIDPASLRPVLPRRSDHLTGRFYRLVPPGTYQLRVYCPGYVPAVAEVVVISSPREVDIGLVRQDSGWQEVAQIPQGMLEEGVRAGGWLAADSAGLVYAARGGKTLDFYRYDPAGDVWLELAQLPGKEQGSQKAPGRGAKGVSDGGRYVYVTRGNNSSEFWRFDGWANRWDSLASVPAGKEGKLIRGGTDLVFVQGQDTSWVYLLKGGTSEFWRYNVPANRWDELPSAPYGRAPRYGEGSFLVYDGHGYIYAHQAKYDSGMNHYMFRYDIRAGLWDSQPLPGMPLAGRYGGTVRHKRSRVGGCGIWKKGAIYALKGGGTGQFYRYVPTLRGWEELDALPVGSAGGGMRQVGAGADMVLLADGTLLAWKGNKTYELWRYVESGKGGRFEVSMNRGGKRGQKVKIDAFPTPLRNGFATLRFTSAPRLAQLRLFDAGGRCVLRQECKEEEGEVVFDLRRLAGGVYLLRLDTAGVVATRKLVLIKEKKP